MERWTITGAQGFRTEPDLIERIFDRDASVWGPGEDDPAERLGWLDLPARMAPQTGSLRSFAAAVAGDGYRRVVVLGMGGSSLAPEVWAETFGSAPGYPSLTVLDSTHPSTVRAATNALDLDHTLWLVSSKSGGTLETISLYRHFRSLHDDGDSFIAITDPGTSLEAMAQDEGFRATFLNPPDIGGRYSALSLFGLVPAALLGVNISELLEGAGVMAETCGPRVDAQSNSALQIGAAVASLAQRGRDKLTWFLSPDIAAFGYWVEQLIAESTGKRGRGITPVVREPLDSIHAYGPDRAFVSLMTEGDSTHAARARDVVAAGHPLIEIEIGGPGDIGAEMWRWELATAVAGAVLGINAFDQPDVEAAKKAARAAMESEGGIEWPEDDPDVLFEDARPPELGALLAFAHADGAATSALDAARRKLLVGHHVATSPGFGPRYLHSTGQLHKGGPPGVRALVVLEESEDDVEIPGSPFGFARLIAAQAVGDANALEAAGRRVARTTRGGFEKWALS